MLPVFARFFHLSPGEFWALTFEEFDAFLQHLEAMVEG